MLNLSGTIGREGFTREVDVSVARGETLAILGPNGAGKSTIIHTVAGLVPLLGGRLSVDAATWDEPATRHWIEPEDRGCAVVFQDLRLFPHMSALRNVEYGLRARGESRGDIARKSRVALDAVGASHLARRSPAELSGGERQRVALARAIVTRPQVLLLDEPLSAVDAGTKSNLRGLIPELLAELGAMTIMVTHDLDDARAMATSRLVLQGI